MFHFQRCQLCLTSLKKPYKTISKSIKTFPKPRNLCSLPFNPAKLPPPWITFWFLPSFFWFFEDYPLTFTSKMAYGSENSAGSISGLYMDSKYYAAYPSGTIFFVAYFVIPRSFFCHFSIPFLSFFDHFPVTFLVTFFCNFLVISLPFRCHFLLFFVLFFFLFLLFWSSHTFSTFFVFLCSLLISFWSFLSFHRYENDWRHSCRRHDCGWPPLESICPC